MSQTTMRLIVLCIRWRLLNQPAYVRRGSKSVWLSKSHENNVFHLIRSFSNHFPNALGFLQVRWQIKYCSENLVRSSGQTVRVQTTKCNIIWSWLTSHLSNKKILMWWDRGDPPTAWIERLESQVETILLRRFLCQTHCEDRRGQDGEIMSVYR